MPAHSLTPTEISYIREIYTKCKVIEETCNITGHQYRTVIKYIKDLLPVRSHLSNSYIVDLYKITGNLSSTAKICNLSTTTIWRRLQEEGISVGSGTADWESLYHTLRARVSRSEWRKNILIRDQEKCIICGKSSVTVHHIKKLSEIRDEVLIKNRELNPFKSRADLRKFTNLVMLEHKEDLGCVMCNDCHDLEHNPNLLKIDTTIDQEKMIIWNQSARILSGTGHRPHKLGYEYTLEGKVSAFLEKEIIKCFNYFKPRRIVSGMAQGFDQLLALTAIKANIKVTAAVPCDGQELIWPEVSQKLYHSILNNSLVETKVISPGPYHITKMDVRNQWMMNNSDAVIAAWDGSKGGTANCVRYAQSTNKLIYRINPKDIGS